ncbi:unnamed protein product [Macrosiphum euphorbiae]|uniref:Uncharacterized protein n=1 Tax=Macrosiphum euphorbiae TaxID=13131 RepID=A0AAV0VS92_9HEMI|nr:unnamed protein product [Macrosiphum euphorbiae]
MTGAKARLGDGMKKVVWADDRPFVFMHWLSCGFFGNLPESTKENFPKRSRRDDVVSENVVQHDINHEPEMLEILCRK